MGNIIIQESEGSAYAGGISSYSGVDIKVLVHIYNPESSAALSARVTPAQREELEKKQKTLLGQIDSLETKLVTAKKGTPQEKRYTSQLQSTLKQEQVIKQTLDSLSQENGDHDQPLGNEQGTTKTLMELQTLSISVHRDKQPVRALGSVYPKSFTRGPRQIAGTMVATVFDKHVFYDLMQSHPSDFDSWSYTSAITDQIPPMDLTVVFANEAGSLSRMALYAVEFFSEGMTLSIEDILTESTFNYVARDFDPMRAVDKRVIDANNQLTNQWQGKKASDLIYESDFQDTKTALDPYHRFSQRNSPYV